MNEGLKQKIGICIMVALFLFVSLCSCADNERPKTSLPGSNAELLDGKSILFAGCSYTYYGGTVEKLGYTITEQEIRDDDHGYFYQLCKANRATVAVTNWCYGGHSLSDLFDGHCDYSKDKGHDHLSDLKNRKFDYVVLQEIKEPEDWTSEDYLQNVKSIMSIFREANPEVQFLYVVHDGVYVGNYSDAWKESVSLIQQEGVTIVDWGTLVWDVMNNYVEVPGAAQTYDKNSFVVSRTEADGYHPNLLSGYLSALMTYCAITGETAVGQAYEFCTDGSISNTYYDTAVFERAFYKWDDKTTPENEMQTNFAQILQSQTEINGLQSLADEYLKNPMHQNDAK